MPSSPAQSRTSDDATSGLPPQQDSTNAMGQTELTPRAVIVGCVLGSVLAAANVYTGLKTAFIDGGNITASVLSFAFFTKVLRTRRPYSSLENNLTQTIASSAALMSMVVGVAGPIPALALSGHFPPLWSVTLWGIALGILGASLARLLRTQLIMIESLPFPTGKATAEVIQAMASQSTSGSQRAGALLAAAAIAGGFTFMRDGPYACIPQEILFPYAISGISLTSLSIGVSMSPLLLATGLLIGVRTGVSLLAGSMLGFVLIGPALARAKIVTGIDHSALVTWLMWPGAALVLSSALTNITVSRHVFVRLLYDARHLLQQLRKSEKHHPERNDLAILAIVSLLCSIGVVGIAAFAFDLSLGSSLFALLLFLGLSSVCARAAGETDIAPVGDMGGLTQLLLGGSGNISSIACGSIVAGGASQTAATLWAFKTGERLGANVRIQLCGQLLGVVVGALVVVPTYAVITRAYPLGSTRLPAPSALSWKATADAVGSGLTTLPRHALSAALIALLLGCVLTLLARTRIAQWTPSPVALGLGFLLPPTLSTTLFIGALILHILSARVPSWSSVYLSSIAGGGIAGESLLAVVLATLLASGVIAN